MTDAIDREKRPPSRMLADTLKQAEQNGRDHITLGDVVECVGSRIYGLGLLLFALPEALPLPTAGVTQVIVVPLFALSGWMLIFGVRRALPGWVCRRTIKRHWLEKIDTKAQPWLKRLERYSHPRRERCSKSVRLIGAVCLLLSALIAAPVPLGNIAPALCIAVLGFGMFQRDGNVIILGLAASLLVVIGMVVAIYFIGRAIS